MLQFQQMSTFAIAQFNKRRPAQLHYKHDIDFTNFCDQIQSESFSKCCPQDISFIIYEFIRNYLSVSVSWHFENVLCVRSIRSSIARLVTVEGTWYTQRVGGAGRAKRLLLSFVPPSYPLPPLMFIPGLSRFFARCFPKNKGQEQCIQLN